MHKSALDTSSSGEGNQFFVAEQALLFKNTSLVESTFHHRWKRLFDVSYNKNNEMCYVIITLFYVKHIKTVMKDLSFPFKTNGMRFVSPNTPEATYIWKRKYDISLNFKIKSTETSTEFLLQNCKKPSFTINNTGAQNKNKCYHDKIVKCLYYDNQWIISSVIDDPVSTQTQLKNIVSFIKENIDLEDIYSSINHDNN
tara:strand:- start:452 stop:1045 length:594 start_codon:yes stop_codon:yes gene_type:complete